MWSSANFWRSVEMPLRKTARESEDMIRLDLENSYGMDSKDDVECRGSAVL